MKKTEFENVKYFNKIIGIENKTDGTLFIYPTPKDKKLGEKISRKPDGYYYMDGVTFILDAKAEGNEFSGQLEDYLKLEQNKNNVGFKYSGIFFQCFINGVLMEEEIEPKNAEYYISKYFNNKITNEDIVNNSAKKLANMFRDSSIDKQMNVPFIGSVMLCQKFGKDISGDSTKNIIRNIKSAIEEIILNEPKTRQEKKEFIKTMLDDPSLNKTKISDIIQIISEISTVYNFINVSDKKGHDTMNSFLKIFRKWNSANSNEKGEVFTPDHIAQLMYKIIDIKFSDTVLDPTCGSGTFLVNALTNMLNETDDENEKKKIMEERVIGIENLSFNATLAGINMLLHGDGASNIFEENCFKKLPQLKGEYNKVLMNPPFSQKDKELKFVLEALNNMKEGGKLATILPINCILGRGDKQNDNLKLKKEILSKHKIIKSVKLPNKLFEPNASTETCIIVFESHAKLEKQVIELYDFSNDGYEIRMRSGRVPINEEEAMISFQNQKPIIKEVTEKDDWLIEPTLDINSFSSEIFQAAKIDYEMREKNLIEILYKNEGKIDLKISTKFKEMSSYNWKEFLISDIFEIEGKGLDKPLYNFDDENKIACINAKKNNNGIGGYCYNPKKIFKPKRFTVVSQGDGGAGMTYFQDDYFCATTSVFVLKPKFEVNVNVGIFIAKICSLKWKRIYSHGKTITREVLLKQSIPLPVSDENKIDFETIENIMK
ncbi:N-6 DNA methylase [Spiroplasma taiwanense]|uniref:site-specific DNA-methyltransferase (adenine-specific) n=1 Tax=Spiroplasma taiwanense CT-1 TaxID=1276220 RepID=S5LU08_9MOLU|nr:N-6 DNA methylase [Spiroplasma taiwanense]AGR41204.1 hypothetical protein STAIW_v1c05820 [Spiroplasma taiwanense CT-1]